MVIVIHIVLCDLPEVSYRFAFFKIKLFPLVGAEESLYPLVVQCSSFSIHRYFHVVIF
jgi:hypothetical protein